MTLPTGTISMSQVNTELGRSASAIISLGESAVRTLAGVASGAISMDNLRGKSNATVNFADVNVLASGNTGQTAGYRIDVDGFDYQVVNGVDTLLSQWASPSTVGDDYEVFATLTDGTLSFGTTGSWVATSGSPFWTRTRPTVGTAIANLTMEVRAVGTTTVLDTWTVTLEAERF